MSEPIDQSSAPVEPTGEPEPGPESTPAPPIPLLGLSDGVPKVTDTLAGLEAACADLASGSGPIAIDAERASGYRYSNRAYLIQLRREGSTTWLIDPPAFDSLGPLASVLEGNEWILHAATQDLPCLTDLGLHPSSLFDTELAGRLLGYPRVGLATLVEEIVGFRLKKEHSAVDWSRRPLPEPWLEYAALDVEVLVELRAALLTQLEEAGKWEWARQEFESLLTFTPTPRVDAWRRTSGIHRLHGKRALGAARELWRERNSIAEETDVTPTRVIPDSAIVVAAKEMPAGRGELLGIQGFHGRGAKRFAARWLEAIGRARSADESDLPTKTAPATGPPAARSWIDRDEEAAARLSKARAGISELSDCLQVPAENLLTPDTMRRVLWQPEAVPPAPRDVIGTEVAAQLRGLGAREWQIELTGPVLADAIAEPDIPEPEPMSESEPEAEPSSEEQAPA